MTIKFRMEEKEQEHFFRILKALAESSDQEAVMFIVDLARNAAFPDAGAWDGIFRTFDDEHPHTERVMKALSNDPPARFTGVLLLDAANSLALDGWQGTHPIAHQGLFTGSRFQRCS